MLIDFSFAVFVIEWQSINLGCCPTSRCSWPVIRRFALYYGQLSLSVMF